MTDQPVVISKTYGKQFAYGYGDIDDENLQKDFVNCCQMNAAAIKGSPMELQSGRWFYDSEYVVNDTIPVIVGSYYQEYLKTGDKVSISYLKKNFECTVIGVLKEGSRTAKNEYDILDDYLIIPALEDAIGPENEVDYSFEQKMYLHHTNGYVYSDKGVLEEQALLDDLCQASDIQPYVFMSVPSFINLFDWGIAKSIRIILIASYVLFVVFAFFLSYLSYRKGRKVAFENIKSFILAKYIESLIMATITVAICIPFVLITIRILGIQWWIAAAAIGVVFLALPSFSILSKLKRRKIINPLIVICFSNKKRKTGS